MTTKETIETKFTEELKDMENQMSQAMNKFFEKENTKAIGKTLENLGKAIQASDTEFTPILKKATTNIINSFMELMVHYGKTIGCITHTIEDTLDNLEKTTKKEVLKHPIIYTQLKMSWEQLSKKFNEK